MAHRQLTSALPALAVGLATTGAALAQADPPAAAPLAQHNCMLKTLSACTSDGACTRLEALKGEKLPIKVTVDFEAGIIAGVDPEGWVNATRIASLARTPDQLMLQGVDNAVLWEMLIYKDQMMSLSLATGDTVNVGFGECTVAKGP
jgi:hypothetical protein